MELVGKSIRTEDQFQIINRERIMKMKADGPNRRKVVVRRLPPSLSPSQFFDQTDRLFSDRYNWASYRPGTVSSRKYQRCSRAYIEFKGPEDVLHFEELFDGHIFINENGVEYKATVEYAPSQSVPKPSTKDGREGTIFIDPEYLEFLKLIAEPFENQQSAENQLEIKETDQTANPSLAEKTSLFGKAIESKILQKVHKDNTSNPSLTANPSLAEKMSLFMKAKESKILQKVHKDNTSNPSLTGDSTTSQTPSKTAKVPGQGSNDRKPSKRQASAHKKQVWVPKTGK